MKKIDQIRKKCEENNLNIYKVFRLANVPSATISNWERKEPKAFEKLEKINNKIDELIAHQKETGIEDVKEVRIEKKTE